MGSLSLLQGILSTQGLIPCLQLSHKQNPRILGSFSRDLPDPGIELGPPALQADSLPTELSGKPNREDCISHLKGNIILNESWLKSGRQIVGGSYGEVQNQSGKHRKWENTGKVN